MSVVELSDEENVAIQAETFTGSLSDLRDRSRQLPVLKRIDRLLSSSAPQRYIYETVRDERRVWPRPRTTDSTPSASGFR